MGERHLPAARAREFGHRVVSGWDKILQKKTAKVRVREAMCLALYLTWMFFVPMWIAAQLVKW